MSSIGGAERAFYLGFDGGGTKTAAVLTDAAGRVIGRGAGGPCNIATSPPETLADSVRNARASALKAAGIPERTVAAGVCAGVAGYTARRRRQEFLGILRECAPAGRHRVEPDYVIAWWGATGGEPGLILSAGTGVAAYGRNGRGESCRVDGRGFLLGDCGGGFDLGRNALQYALRTLDEGHPMDDFTLRLLAEIGAEGADDLVEWTYRDFSPQRVASLAELVGRWAEEGDPAARVLIGGLIVPLCASTLQAVHRLGESLESLPLSLLGGLWNICAPLRDEFLHALSLRAAPPEHPDRPARLTIVPPKTDAAHGAAILAREEAECACN